MTTKIDVRKTMKALYQPPAGQFVSVDVPTLRYVMVDGSGDPNVSDDYRGALEWLYSTSYALKFAARSALGQDYVVPPLQGLWWADDPADFVRRNKAAWHWTMMILVPDLVPADLFGGAVARAANKRGDPPPSLRMHTLSEGPSLQTLHIGSYDDEGPTLARLHDEVMPGRGLTFNGPHHEIYLSDPRRVAPERLRTVLRQPVKPLAA